MRIKKTKKGYRSMADIFLSLRGLWNKNIGVGWISAKMSTFLFLYIFKQVRSERDKFIFLSFFHFLHSFILTVYINYTCELILMAASTDLSTQTQDDF